MISHSCQSHEWAVRATGPQLWHLINLPVESRLTHTWQKKLTKQTKKILSFLFEPFITTSWPANRNVAELMDRCLQRDSAGSTFWFSLVLLVWQRLGVRRPQRTEEGPSGQYYGGPEVQTCFQNVNRFSKV